MKHKPNCASNISCAVYHENGVCPGYKKCDCGADQVELAKDFKKTIEEIGKDLKKNLAGN